MIPKEFRVKQHVYNVTTQWTGNDGPGTRSYAAYRRDHELSVAGKPTIPASSDPAFRGDRTRYNPEELLVASVSSCHMLWYLHLCVVNKVVVLNYSDAALGTMEEEADGAGQFARIVLKPTVTITPESDGVRARELHHEAHRFCFIARSVNFPVEVAAEIVESAAVVAQAPQ
jgi:organic hydroperoxide reductase OsmC/OhrA